MYASSNDLHEFLAAKDKHLEADKLLTSLANIKLDPKNTGDKYSSLFISQAVAKKKVL
jgi:hypothetical protein